MDDLTTVEHLRAEVRSFVERRDWRQYHTPKNLAMSIAIEAAEIMEHFQWLTVDESAAALADPEVHHAVADELADVIISHRHRGPWARRHRAPAHPGLRRPPRGFVWVTNDE